MIPKNAFWQLFLDDERYPANPTFKDHWMIARNVDDAMWYIKTYGIPMHMALDHDLGYRKMTGHDFTKKFLNYLMDNNLRLPAVFTYYVHSQNPVGVKNIEATMKDILKWNEMEGW